MNRLVDRDGNWYNFTGTASEMIAKFKKKCLF